MSEVVTWSQGPAVGERKRSGFMAWDLLLVVSLGLLLANFITALALGSDGESSGDTDPIFLWVGVGFNFLIFAIIPLAWAFSTIEGGWVGVRKFLGMKGGLSELGIGAGLGVVMVMVLGGLALLADRYGLVPESAPITDLLSGITWPLAIAFSFVAGFGEEILFRGVLQRWLQWWGQGIVFGLLHYTNAGWFAVIAVGIVGLFFGYLRHRGVSLWTLISAHFVYDIILIGAAILAPEDAIGGGTAL